MLLVSKLSQAGDLDYQWTYHICDAIWENPSDVANHFEKWLEIARKLVYNSIETFFFFFFFGNLRFLARPHFVHCPFFYITLFLCSAWQRPRAKNLLHICFIYHNTHIPLLYPTLDTTSQHHLIITLDVNVIQTKLTQFWIEPISSFKMRSKTQFSILLFTDRITYSLTTTLGYWHFSKGNIYHRWNFTKIARK